MGSVQQGPVNRKGNKLQIARADLTRALRRVAKAMAGYDATFTRLEVAALEVADEAARDFCEQELQSISDSFDDELLIDGVLCKRSHSRHRGSSSKRARNVALTKAARHIRTRPTLSPQRLRNRSVRVTRSAGTICGRETPMRSVGPSPWSLADAP